jgi:hypothetical protein
MNLNNKNTKLAEKLQMSSQFTASQRISNGAASNTNTNTRKTRKACEISSRKTPSSTSSSNQAKSSQQEAPSTTLSTQNKQAKPAPLESRAAQNIEDLKIALDSTNDLNEKLKQEIIMLKELIRDRDKQDRSRQIALDKITFDLQEATQKKSDYERFLGLLMLKLFESL